MYQLIIIPIVAAVIVQAIKLITDGKPKNFNFHHMISDYGGMPSSHAAFVASLATIVGLADGFDSTTFAITFILFAIVIRDAIGFRREIGRNAVLTNQIAKATIDKQKPQYLNEQVGHTPLQVLVGSALGVAITIIMAKFFNI